MPDDSLVGAENTGQPAQSDPVSTLFRLVWGYAASATIATALDLELPDRLGEDTRSVKDLAAETGAHEPSLDRLLRALVSIGVIAEPEPGMFTLTRSGALLRTDVPHSMYSLARLMLHQSMWRPWAGLTTSIQTGERNFEELFGMSYWTYMKQNPEVSDLFNSAMGQATQDIVSAVVHGYDFSRYGTVVDIGGGNGTLISAILRSSPESRGIVFDSSTGVEKAAQVLADEGVADRCDIHSGDFFVAVPRGGDAYVMKSIIHDWSDEQSMVILRNCREAVPADGRLLIIDPVLPPPPVTESLASPFAYLNDLAMLVKLGGKERTEAEYEALLSAAGFRKTQVVPLAGPARICLIEAVPVP